MNFNVKGSQLSNLIKDIPKEIFINGEWLATDKKFQVLNPADTTVIAEMSTANSDLALNALNAAEEAQKNWAGLAPRVRANLFHNAYKMLADNEDLFAHVMTLESGKPLTEARGEFKLSLEFFLWYAEQIAHIHGTYSNSSHGGYKIVSTHKPVGPCLLITPWNFPLLMVARKAGAALAAGCTVIVKSARETPLTSALFIKILNEAGFPKGVVNLLHAASAAEISNTLLDDKRIKKVSFTGSTEVGSTLLNLASKNIINSSMELGGDGPFVVFDDANINEAVEHAVACKFRNAGQACVAANRIIVHRSVYQEFKDKFISQTKKLVVGDGFGQVDIGPIVSEKQIARVAKLVKELVGNGGDLLLGGKKIDKKGYFFEPTIFEFKDKNNLICGQELFAPIATLIPVDSNEEAIEFANNTPYGLAAYLFTQNLDNAFNYGEQLEFGMVGINRGIMADPAAPFGGIKASGLGREGGHDGIYEFLEPQYLAVTIR